jgi:hypothetical protein
VSFLTLRSQYTGKIHIKVAFLNRFHDVTTVVCFTRSILIAEGKKPSCLEFLLLRDSAWCGKCIDSGHLFTRGLTCVYSGTCQDISGPICLHSPHVPFEDSFLNSNH